MASPHVYADPYEEPDYRKTTAKTRVNPLLVKPQTGKVRASTYNLPPEGFTYGRRDQYVEDGVKEAVNSWVTHTPIPEAVPGRDFVRLNRSAVMKGATSSKDIATFRSTHDFRLKSLNEIRKGGYSEHTTVLPLDHTSVFGRPSKPSTPIHDVLTNTYQRNAIIEARLKKERMEAERARHDASKAGRWGQSQHTRASLGHFKVTGPPPKEPFKLEKFKQAPPRIGHQGLNTGACNPLNRSLQEKQYQQYLARTSPIKQQTGEQGYQAYDETKQAEHYSASSNGNDNGNGAHTDAFEEKEQTTSN